MLESNSFEQSIITRYQAAMLPLFNPLKVMSHGKGVYLYDLAGNKYLDLLAGIAVNSLGYGHESLVEAICEQAKAAIHISNFFTSKPQVELAEKLISLAQAPSGSGVFLVNSGTEANEAALKIAKRTGKPRVLALNGSFHGRTLGSLSMTSKKEYREPFAPLVPGVSFIEPGNVIQLETELKKQDVAAVIAEPIQAEAGVKPLSTEYLKALRDLTKKYEALLILDEVQTGVGRLGAWFGHQLADIKPDVMTLAKGLGSGVPIGAVVTFGSKITHLLSPGQHGTTFGGNPLAAKAALTVLNTIEEESLLEQITRASSAFRDQLKALDLPQISEVRGQGLLIGIEFSADYAKALSQAAFEAGFIVNATDERTLRLCPPLIIKPAEFVEFAKALPAVLSSVEMKDRS